MFNLFDMMQGQGGPDIQAFGQQFGLSQDQTRRAMETLMPALTVGLQRNAFSDPTGFGRYLGLVAPEPFTGSRPQIPMQPEMLLGQLFGSPLVSQTVLQQAAAASGIGTQALKQMLPVMAGMIVASIVHVLINQPPPAAPAPHYKAAPPEPVGFPVANFWNDWMEGFLKPNATDNERSVPREGKRPTEKVAAPTPTVLPPPAAETATPAPKEASYEGLQEIFQTGIQVQEQNVKAMQDIFDAFWSAQGSANTPVDKPAKTTAPKSTPAARKSPPRTSAAPSGKPVRKAT